MEQTAAEARVMRAIIAREARKARALRAASVPPAPEPAPPTGWDSSPDPARRKTRMERAAEERRQAARLDWCRRHPDRAAEERGFRKERIDARRTFAGEHDGTVETRRHAARQRQGAISRLWESGSLDDDQMAAATAIARVHERVADDVRIRTGSPETRIDAGRRGDGHFYEALGAVHDEMAYSRWRWWIGPAAAALVLDVVAADTGLAEAARRHAMGYRRARAVLIDALDRWDGYRTLARALVDQGDLDRAHADLA